jgi:hypothetical protein
MLGIENLIERETETYALDQCLVISCPKLLSVQLWIAHAHTRIGAYFFFEKLDGGKMCSRGDNMLLSDHEIEIQLDTNSSLASRMNALRAVSTGPGAW